MGNPFIVAEDLAVKTLLAGMTVSDEKSAARQVKVWFGYPDVEVRTQDFPFVTIDLIDIVPANDRQTSGRFSDNDNRGTQAPVGDYVYTYDVPVAYDLIYQITSHARHPRHDRAIMLQLMRKFPSKFGYLVVPNELGTENSRRHMFLDGFVKRDTAESETGNRRLLRNVLTVRVISEMTPEQATAYRVSDTVSINTTNSDIPSGYNPL
jgi:hypothetical protein